VAGKSPDWLADWLTWDDVQEAAPVPSQSYAHRLSTRSSTNPKI
jgi:hypothetical protein